MAEDNFMTIEELLEDSLGNKEFKSEDEMVEEDFPNYDANRQVQEKRL